MRYTKYRFFKVIDSTSLKILTFTVVITILINLITSSFELFSLIGMLTVIFLLLTLVFGTIWIGYWTKYENKRQAKKENYHNDLINTILQTLNQQTDKIKIKAEYNEEKIFEELKTKWLVFPGFLICLFASILLTSIIRTNFIKEQNKASINIERSLIEIKDSLYNISK